MRTLLVAVVVGLLVSAGEAAARTVAIDGPAVADGKRWAAWKPDVRTAVVYDDRTRRRVHAAVPECPLGGVTAGTLLVQCGMDPLLVDVATGVVTNVGGPDLVADVLGLYSFVGLGSHGLLVYDQGYHYEAVFAFDWRTRRRQTLDHRRRVVDLNRPELTRPLCAGLARSPNPDADDPSENLPPYLPMAYSGRRAVEYVHGRLRRWRCGVDRPRRIKICVCRDVNLAAGLVTWADRRARALDFASGKRRAWRFPPGYGRVAQAGRTLLLWTAPATTSEPPARLRVVRW
jgi:hypothetical protein